jgi:hypothetical protein
MSIGAATCVYGRARGAAGNRTDCYASDDTRSGCCTDNSTQQ